jgi:hypothetical protein
VAEVIKETDSVKADDLCATIWQVLTERERLRQTICSKCGVAQFEVPESELQVLREGSRYLDLEASKTKGIEQKRTFPQERKVA